MEVTPEAVVATWKSEFPTFWPTGNTFYAPLAGIRPGEVALLSAAVAGPVKLHTGVMVLYADDEAFTLMTPEGHMLAAWITFSAFREGDGTVVAQAQALERASDPLFEVGLALGGHAINNRSGRRPAATSPRGSALRGRRSRRRCVDKRRQWRQAANVRHNAGFRSALHVVVTPIRVLRRRG